MSFWEQGKGNAKERVILDAFERRARALPGRALD